jgi:uncharacterized membrane protein (DUF4010 family)
LQRERTESALAGIRTFPLITVLGTVAALLGETLGGWVVGLGFAALAAVVVMGNVVRLRAGRVDPGLTTEMAMLLMYGVGAYLVIGQPAVAIVVGGGTAVLLQLKKPMHAWVDRIGDDDLRAIMRFVVITLVILPVLPNRDYGPYDVLNPYEIWWMVVLIVGLSLAGYLAFKLFGERTGTALAGVLGGLISSTATTVTYSQASRATPRSSRLAAVVVLIASSATFVRVLVEIGAVAPGIFATAGPPLATMLGFMVLLSAGVWFLGRSKESTAPSHENPSELKSALVFGFLYALVLLAVAAAEEHLGDRGLYAVAVLSGLTDMDAITLSTAQMAKDARIAVDTAWRLILVASLSNLVFKLGIVAVLGNRRLLLRVGTYFAVAAAGGLAIFFLWP